MRRIAHIVHPVVVDSVSDLNIAQPITYETMRRAQEFARGHVDVELFFTKYHDENPLIPEGFQGTPDLTRSVLDVAKFEKKRKLALIGDVLDRLYEATEADYLIYTNVDIALMPYFYTAVNQLIDRGYDAFSINRRTISKSYHSLDDIPLMYAQVGEKHQGHDCLVFERGVYPNCYLGTTCVGTSRVGAVLAVNLIYSARRFKQFTNLHVTFHVGNDKVWRSPHFSDYARHNENGLKTVLEHYGAFQHPRVHPMVERLVKQYAPQSASQRMAHVSTRLWKKAKWIWRTRLAPSETRTSHRSEAELIRSKNLHGCGCSLAPCGEYATHENTGSNVRTDCLCVLPLRIRSECRRREQMDGSTSGRGHARADTPRP